MASKNEKNKSLSDKLKNSIKSFFSHTKVMKALSPTATTPSNDSTIHLPRVTDAQRAAAYSYLLSNPRAIYELAKSRDEQVPINLRVQRNLTAFTPKLDEGQLYIQAKDLNHTSKHKTHVLSTKEILKYAELAQSNKSQNTSRQTARQEVKHQTDSNPPQKLRR